MAAADQNIAMMDGTYFVGRKEILDWVNGICCTSLSKVEQTCTGAVACMILDSMYPGKVPMSKVDWSANKDYEYINNYKVLQKCFTNLKIDKHIEVDRLVRGKYQDNLEFMQWFKKFYELNASGQPYDAIAVREKGKGGALYTSKFGGSAAARRKPASTLGATRTTAAKPPGAPVSGSRVGATGTKSAVGATRRPVGSAGGAVPAAPVVAAGNAELERELEELTGVNETLTNENGELRLAVEGLEKERDFYFGKLRDIEILLQGTEGSDADPIAQSVFKILYATEEEFAAGEGAEPQDEEM
ncbi:Microtubule -associated protein eb1 [Globisporangium polare]